MVPPTHQSFGFPLLTIDTRWPGLQRNYFLRQTDNGERWMMDGWVDPFKQ